MDQELISEIRQAANVGLALGNDKFKEEVERLKRGMGRLGVRRVLQRFDFPLENSGTWSVNSTNEIVLVGEGGVQRLQSSPNGEVLTVISNDQRLAEGDPTAPGFFNSFIADTVYIQLPE